VRIDVVGVGNDDRGRRVDPHDLRLDARRIARVTRAYPFDAAETGGRYGVTTR
jgi:hypothetical protein